MITSLSLENWKSHSKTELSFGRGTNVLVGRMGSGKSSVLDALCFALYGTFPKMSRRDQTVEDLVNSASGASVALVKLEFDKGGKKYSVTRKIGRKTSEAEVHLDGKLVQKGAKAATDYVTGVLAVDYELFTRAIYSEQNRIDYLLSLNPKQRKGEIDWLLGLGQFDTAREAAQQAYGKLSDSAQAYSKEAEAGKVTELQQKMEWQGKELEAKKAAYAAMQERSKALSSEVTRQAQDMLVLEKLRGAYSRKKSDCERLEGAVQGLQKEAHGKKKPSQAELDSYSEDYSKRQEALLAARQSLQELQNGLSGLKSEIGILENGTKLAQARAKRAGELDGKVRGLLSGKVIAELNSEAENTKQEAESLSSIHSQLHAEIAQLVSAVETLSSAGAKCPVCDSDLSSGKAGRISDGKRAVLEDKKAKLDSTGKQMREKKAELSALEKKANDLALCNAELARLRSEGIDVSVFEDEIAKKKDLRMAAEKKLSAEQEGMKKLESALEKARAALDDANRASKLFAELDSSSEKLAAAKDELSKMDFSEQTYEEKRKSYEELRLQAAKLEAETAGFASQMGLMGEVFASLEKGMSYLQEKGRLAAGYAGAAEGMAIYKNSLAATQSELRSNLVEEINSALCEVWPAVYPYSDYGGVKIEADEKDYRLLMEKGSIWKEVDSIASGGERACLCLALRIAFATVLTPDIGWLILDEPTHNLDADAVLLLSEAINTKIPSIVEQTFVITHDNALGEASEGTVFRLERDKGKNESTKVEKAG